MRATARASKLESGQRSTTPISIRSTDARVDLTVTTPSGQTEKIAVEWSPRENGVYDGVWVPGEEGLHQLSLEAGGKGASCRPILWWIQHLLSDRFRGT